MMLERNVAGLISSGSKIAAPELGRSAQLRHYLGMARRQWLVVLAILLLAAGCAAAYLLVTPPAYQARAQVLLDTRKLQLFQQQSLIQDPTFDTPAVESQMEVIRSESIGATIVDNLKLADDPEFTGGRTTGVQALAANVLRRIQPSLAYRLFEPASVSQADRRRAALNYLRTNLLVQRVRTTYVIEIAFPSLDPLKAARIANAVADAYIVEQTETRQYTTRRAINWLEERMTELRDQSVRAEKAVEDFRTKNNMVRVSGAMLSDQQLFELNARLTRDREATAEAKRRLDRLREIMNSPVPDAGMSAWLNNDIISKLRLQYLEATRREADYMTRLGPTHEAVLRARKESRQIERAAAEEMRRIAQTWTAEYEAAQSRQASTEAALAEGQNRNEASRQEQGALQMLESTSKTYRSLHDTFLQRFVEATTQQNFQSTEARVITPASAGRKFQPNPQQVLIMGCVLGLALGVAVAFGRERFNEVLRTPEEARRALGMECFGVLPAVSTKEPRRRRRDQLVCDPTDRTVPAELGIARQVLKSPFSRFAETMRSMKVAVDAPAIGHRVVGLTSALPEEGKSTVAANFAQLAASGGRKVLLIDCDLRQPSLSRSMAPGSQIGLLQVLSGTVPLHEAVWHDPATGMDFLPTATEGSVSHASELLASRAMIDLLSLARERYEYVIVDFPPLTPVVDAKAAGHLIDGFVLVVEWGETPEAAIFEALASADVIQNKLLGVVLNKADIQAVQRLESYKGSGYYNYFSSKPDERLKRALTSGSSVVRRVTLRSPMRASS